MGRRIYSWDIPLTWWAVQNAVGEAKDLGRTFFSLIFHWVCSEPANAIVVKYRYDSYTASKFMRFSLVGEGENEPFGILTK
jgi:hypothetical protein